MLGIDDDLASSWYEKIGRRHRADGWIVGRATIQELVGNSKGKPKVRQSVGRIAREPHVAARRGRDVAVAIDPHGKVHHRTDNVGGDHLVAVLGEQVSNRYLAELREVGVSYLFAGPDGHDLHNAMDTLGGVFGLTTLSLEGGGKINGAFLKAGLIDEISLLVYPGIDGQAGVSSIFEYVGKPGEKPGAGWVLRHIGTQTLAGGVVWLRYAVGKAF